MDGSNLEGDLPNGKAEGILIVHAQYLQHPAQQEEVAGRRGLRRSLNHVLTRRVLDWITRGLSPEGAIVSSRGRQPPAQARPSPSPEGAAVGA